MDRRKILKYVAYATGVAVAAPIASSLLVACQSEAAPPATVATTSNLHFFKPSEFSLIQEIVDIILPKTDSPSATEVGVHTMIDQMVGLAYRPEDKKTYQKQIAAFFKYLEQKGYSDLGEADKMKALTALDTVTDATLEDAKNGYTALKQQTIAYYLTTKTIGTKFLNYLPVPGEYKPCISLEEAGGKAWAI